MKNVKPRTIPALLTACQKAVTGSALVAEAIGIFYNKPDAINVDINGVLAERDAYEAGKAELSARRATVRSLAQDGRDFLTITRDVLKKRFGGQYTQAWDPTGFIGSLAIPTTTDDVQAFLQSIQRYLGLNPTAEVAALEVTAAKAEELFNDLNAAQGAVNAQETVVGNLMQARDAAAEKLQSRLSWLIEELGRLIDPLDQRWLSFGLNMPGADEVPDVPENISAVLIGPNAVSVKWTGAPRAAYYRVWKKVDGVDQELIVVGSPADLDFTIEGLPANASIQIAVSAVNNGGESALSTAVVVQTH